MRKMLQRVLAIITLLVLFATFPVSAAYSTGSCISYVRNSTATPAYGVKGDFKLPAIDSKWSTTNKENFINFEEWIKINGGTGDWLELGYTDGGIEEGSGIIYTKGFFKAKQFNGLYQEARISKTATVGTRYTFTIVDTNQSGTWEIYIGSTYIGTFSGTIPPCSFLEVHQGYEVRWQAVTPSLSSTDITNSYFRKNGTWNRWNTASVGKYDALNYVNVAYSSANNISTFTKQ